ncbi:hypothetical protein ACEPAG_9691 [Sanghuangporus baumii]
MSETKHSSWPFHASHGKVEVEERDENHISGLQLGHVDGCDKELKDTEVKEARNAEFAAAVAAGGTDPLSKAAFVIYACAAAAFMCSCGNGYDGSLMTAINGMPFYQNRFNQGQLDVSTGIIFSIYTIGQMAGSLFAGQICDRFGRRAGMFVGCLTIMLGSAIISATMHRPQFIAGRFILGMGIAIATIAAPTYTVEVAPPQWRGRLTSLYNTGWNGGAIPAAAITLGTANLNSDWSWRIPLILQAFPATLVVLTVWFLPESPRWHYMHGQEKRAFDFLTKYHGNGNFSNPIVQLQIREFRENISLNGSDKRWWDYGALVKNHNARWRMLMVFLMGFFGQMSGNGLGYFNLSIYEALGFDKKMQFNMNLIGTCCNALVAWTAVSLEDRMPRRRVLIWGTLLCSLMLAANTGFSAAWANYQSGHENLSVGRAGAAFFFLFNVVYGFTYTPLQSLYPAECLETTTRAKGVAMKIFIISCTSFINLFCTPIAFGRIGWKYIIVFVFWDAFEAVIWYFFCVETVGYTLEELDEIFSAPNPVKASTQKKKIAAKKTGDVVIIAAMRSLLPQLLHDEPHEAGLHRTDGFSEKPQDAEIKKEQTIELVSQASTGRTVALSKSAFVIYACVATAFMVACVDGYDSSLMPSITVMPFYQDRFSQGHLDVSTGIIFSIYSIGQMTAAIISSAMHRPQFIAGRFILGMGVTIATVASGTYIVEFAPPQWRGRLTPLYTIGYFAGSIPAAAITLGTSALYSDWSWRIPLILQAFPAILVVLIVWSVPESPRWYFMHGKEEKAFDFLIKYHGNGDIQNPIVQLEIREFKANISLNGSDKRWWDFKALVNNHNARRRILVVFLMGLFGQMSGNGLGYFNLSIYQALGFDKRMQFNMNLIQGCCIALVAWIAVSLQDRLPRRRVLIWGTLACSVMLAGNAGFSAAWASYQPGHENLSVGRAGAAFFFLFNSVYGFTYVPLQALYPTECLETTTRAKGVALQILVFSCTSFINLFCTPIALGRIGWKYIIIFVIWDAFEAVIWYFFCVETVGFTLEELDEIFSSPNPVKASIQKRKLAMKTGDVVTVDA